MGTLGYKFSEDYKAKMSKVKKEFYQKNPRRHKEIRHHRKGYVFIYKPDHPFSYKDGYILGHRFVMEKHIGRYLTPEEVVHHKGVRYPLGSIENKRDNRFENLKLFANDLQHRKFEKELVLS